MTALTKVSEPGLDLDAVLSRPPLSTILSGGNSLREETAKILNLLEKEALISQKGGRFWLLAAGASKVSEWATIRETEKQQAYGQPLVVDLKAAYPKLAPAQEENCAQLAESVLVTTFANRGLTIANKVFSGQSAGNEELSDIFGYIAETARRLADVELQAAFVEAVHRFVVDPTPPQKKYLASVSQGFFLFHFLGLDPACARLRRQVFEQTLWLCDSSVLLPLLAAGCYNNAYATELFAMLRRANAKIFTTSSNSSGVPKYTLWWLMFSGM